MAMLEQVDNQLLHSQYINIQKQTRTYVPAFPLQSVLLIFLTIVILNSFQQTTYVYTRTDYTCSLVRNRYILVTCSISSSLPY